MRSKLLAVIPCVALLGLLCLTGCSSTTGTHNEQTSNFLGIIKIKQNQFSPARDTNGIVVNSDELIARDLPSGTSVELAWGAITFTDY